MSDAASWEYIVVGAGHNGLSAACTLAAEGRSVLVVEQLPFIGGLSASRPWVEDAPDHLLSVGAMDDMLMAQTPLTDELGLKAHGYVPVPLEAPYGWVDEDGETLLLFRDFERTVRDIKRFSPKDAQTYRDLKPLLDLMLDLTERLVTSGPSDGLGRGEKAKLLLKLAPDRKARATLAKMLQLNVFEMISETFESDAMKGLWGYWTSMLGPADLDGTGVYLMGFHAVHRRAGVLRPKGGMTGLMNAFRSYITSFGGEVRTGSDVERILVDGNRAVGVRLTDGSELRATRGVLANCAPQVALGRLLDDGVLDQKMANKVAMIPANAVNSGAMKIDMALARRIGYPLAESRRQDGFDIRKTTLMTGTLEEHMAQLQALKVGRTVDVPPVYMAILSAADRTIVPEDGDVLYLHSNVPTDPVGGWTAETKQWYTDQIVTSARRFIGGLESEIGRIVHTPMDIEERFAAPKGAYFHVDMGPLRLGVNRPAHGLGGYKTPVTGLYLAGAGSHPGGTVNGWCGRLAARAAMSDEPETGERHAASRPATAGVPA